MTRAIFKLRHHEDTAETGSNAKRLTLAENHLAVTIPAIPVFKAVRFPQAQLPPPHMPFTLSELFPDEDYRFHLTLRRGDVAAFFSQPDSAVLAERRAWLTADPDRYVLADSESHDVVEEMEEMLRFSSPSVGSVDTAVATRNRLVALGSGLEPDFVLLRRDSDAVLRVRAGVVCFPSWWALEEKRGQTVDTIHAVVPGLNTSLGSVITPFLDKLKPGLPYERSNWGLAATPELNLHPALQRPRLQAPLDVEQTWVRIEDQILAALPRSRGLLFGIAIRVVPLRRLLDESSLRRGFLRAIRTMPSELAEYKGMKPVMRDLLALPDI
ncbi:MAG TPA: DUF3445 domain-containing protein [Opitutaceae bacterium]|nr:DUF3445 domain-containing protein [Opitutaceae bacterium]